MDVSVVPFEIATIILRMEDISRARTHSCWADRGFGRASAGLGKTGLALRQDNHPEGKEKTKTIGDHQEGVADTIPT